MVSPEMLRLALLGKVVSTGDDVSLLPQDVLPGRGQPLAGRGGPAQSWPTGSATCWTSALLKVVAVEDADAGAGHHGHRGRLAVDGPSSVGGGTAPAARPDRTPAVDRPGDAAAQHRRPARAAGPGQGADELLDLGFHHGEVLGRLGTKVSLGVLISGPSGSGKSALVRAVAAQVGARVRGRSGRRNWPR